MTWPTDAAMRLQPFGDSVVIIDGDRTAMRRCFVVELDERERLARRERGELVTHAFLFCRRPSVSQHDAIVHNGRDYSVASVSRTGGKTTRLIWRVVCNQIEPKPAPSKAAPRTVALPAIRKARAPKAATPRRESRLPMTKQAAPRKPKATREPGITIDREELMDELFGHRPGVSRV